MRTLADALDCAVISPVLAELWCKQNKLPSPYKTAFERQCSVIFFLCGVMCLSNGLWLGDYLGWPTNNLILMSIILCFSGGILFLISLAFFMMWIVTHKKADIKFLRDCTQLARFLFNPGCFGKELLYERAREKMIFCVNMLLKNEQVEGRGQPTAELSRETLKNAHAIMLRFGLVNEKWDTYFSEAEVKAKE
ncbi:MAG: hypothetical protein Q7R63_00910 [bacterium]|nr:hypothetical protein [bacterium]